MYLLDQHTKTIMEECKSRSLHAGLRIDSETLEYIVTNRDMLDLSPKVMIPTLYDFWVNDVEVLKEYGKYKLYPSNPYETVINSRPAISFYNDNNPDWMNIMIFYHVLGHIDFFQNNRMFEHTWNDDFVGVALADKRLIESYRSKFGRWTDYVIEFARSIDNIVGYYKTLARFEYPTNREPEEKLRFYFNTFLPEVLKVADLVIFKEQERYNKLFDENPEMAPSSFFAEVRQKHPEFQASFDKWNGDAVATFDLLDFIIQHSPQLKKEENNWMKAVMSVVRNTALYFAPQIRTKIINEGWASYWHDKLFSIDERIKGHEVAYARLNAGVTSISRIGLNPYAIGLRLIQYVEELADKGKLSYNYSKLHNAEARNSFDAQTGKGLDAIFDLRKNFSDFTMIKTFVDQDFVDKHNLFTVGKRMNEEKGVVEYYIKSRKAEDYKQMLIDSLYDPPVIMPDLNQSNDNLLYLIHRFEGKQLVSDFVPEVMIGLEFLWGGEVQLETTEIYESKNTTDDKDPYEYRRVLFSCKERKVSKTNL